MFGGGSTDWCGQKTVCHGRTVVGGENGGVGWKVHRSPTGAGGVRGRSEKLLDWYVQLVLPPHAWRLPPCIKLPHPLLQQHFCFPVSSSHHRHAVHFTLPPASPPSSLPHHLTHVRAARGTRVQGPVSISSLLYSQCLQQCLVPSRRIFVGQMNVFIGTCLRLRERPP